jgi:hypothetical protein
MASHGGKQLVTPVPPKSSTFILTPFVDSIFLLSGLTPLCK